MTNIRDTDTSLWLHNKLGTSADSWAGGSIWSQLNADVLKNIKYCFIDLQTQVKIKLLLSFFQIPKKNIEEWKSELDDILEIAAADDEAWVAMIAEVMKPFPQSGTINAEINAPPDNKQIFDDMRNDIKKILDEQKELCKLLPLECIYLNKIVLKSFTGPSLEPVKHFKLKREPKAAALRAELLSKSLEVANNSKRNVVPSLPLRTKGLPRKMNDSVPLKGIPNRVNYSKAYGNNFSKLSTNSTLTKPTVRNQGVVKEGGIKFLDINEQPLGSAQAKKRRRVAEAESTNEQPDNSTKTPDYAAGLTPNPLSSTILVPNTAYFPTTTTELSGESHYSDISTSLSDVSGHASHNIFEDDTSDRFKHNVGTNEAYLFSTNQPKTLGHASAMSVQNQAVNSVQHEESPKTIKLQLSKEQIAEAQKIFSNSNKVTRPEKALILGFMAGSRKNPCPRLGNVVTIKLSENRQVLVQPDGTTINMIAETHFQMNYDTGEWKELHKLKPWDGS